VTDSFNVKIDDGLGAFSRLEEGHIVPIIHEEIFCQDGGAPGMPEDVKVPLDVWISVSIILPDVVSKELCLRCLVQARCQAVCTGFSDGGKAAPASGIQPLLAIAGSVDVNGDKNYLAGPKSLTDLVDSAAALLQGNIFSLRNQEPAVQPQLQKSFTDTEGEVAVIGIFAEVPVGAAFAGRFIAVAIVEKDDHSCRLGFDDKLEIICGNNYFREIPLSLH
jgi:hypothetical protein